MRTSICSWKATVRVDLLVNTFLGGIGEGGRGGGRGGGILWRSKGGTLGTGRASKEGGGTLGKCKEGGGAVVKRKGEGDTLIIENLLDFHRDGRLRLTG